MTTALAPTRDTRTQLTLSLAEARQTLLQATADQRRKDSTTNRAHVTEAQKCLDILLDRYLALAR